MAIPPTVIRNSATGAVDTSRAAASPFDPIIDAVMERLQLPANNPTARKQAEAILGQAVSLLVTPPDVLFAQEQQLAAQEGKQVERAEFDQKLAGIQAEFSDKLGAENIEAAAKLIQSMAAAKKGAPAPAETPAATAKNENWAPPAGGPVKDDFRPAAAAKGRAGPSAAEINAQAQAEAQAFAARRQLDNALHAQHQQEFYGVKVDPQTGTVEVMLWWNAKKTNKNIERDILADLQKLGVNVDPQAVSFTYGGKELVDNLKALKKQSPAEYAQLQASVQGGGVETASASEVGGRQYRVEQPVEQPGMRPEERPGQAIEPAPVNLASAEQSEQERAKDADGAVPVQNWL